MASNNVIANLTQKAIISPILHDSLNNPIPWNDAVANMAASSIWSNLNNGAAYGSFLEEIDGRISFVPEAKGMFNINCLVSFTDPHTAKRRSVTATLKVTIIESGSGGDCCEVKISTVADNRLRKDDEGALLVPEMNVDLIAWFELGKA